MCALHEQVQRAFSLHRKMAEPHEDNSAQEFGLVQKKELASAKATASSAFYDPRCRIQGFLGYHGGSGWQAEEITYFNLRSCPK